ncbi:shikimate 5-dehydrogenase [Pleurocapsa sp. PCC 7327]|uniref:shikimate dehydrogenase n=1 Tax=Pleurocapsa sp. PCC 7327 TaxID=118163 RepID=UPI00029FC8D4|nr:shikimate dehydrogenase [Pleurocapsa sp. PCC 7327]AFY78396.1 shikimate 5-dehydrogenase [Pleurocapsa sp. PCC 7327]
MQLITGKTKLLGVIGDPVEHSLSPVMHNAAIAHLRVNYVYVPFPVKGKDLEKAIAGFEAIGVVGFNITIPHKQAIIPLLSEVSAAAQLVGAVNTVWRTEAGWCGTNTDVEGFLAPLKELDRDWTQVTPIILGNGGAARAVVVGCAEIGCPKIRVVGRDRTKLEKFKQSWQNSALKTEIEVHEWSELAELVSDTKLLVNTTPVGMYPKVNESPVDAVVMEKMPTDAIAYDLIYTPNPTQFLVRAKERGAKAIDGLKMLVEQGASALKIWLQQPVPVDVMRRSLQQYLGH